MSSTRARDQERTIERLQDHRKLGIIERLTAARDGTWAIIDKLSDADVAKQHSPLMSPPIWDLAHIGNFEELWLVQQLGNRAALNPLYDQMYDAFKNARRDRINLPLLDRDQCRAYLKLVREEALEQLQNTNLVDVDPLTHDGYVFEMIIQHEYQHEETLLATLQLMDEPGFRPERPPVRRGGVPREPMVFVEAGPFMMGTADRTRAYDNERPEHEVTLPSFWIDTTPVTNGAYLDFINDNGYSQHQYWSPPGQQWLSESQAISPQFWRQTLDGWQVNTFGFREPLNPRQPVQHVCFWEAEAFARWQGKRLPTEAEWEKAASWDPIAQRRRVYPWGDDEPTGEHANLNQVNFAPLEVGAYPLGASPYGCHQMIGDVWEWVDSDFVPYPGFKAFPYKEYSEVFFGPDYKVLRGGSWAVRAGAIRNTFRNWDYPIRRQIFSGFRCAKDAQ